MAGSRTRVNCLEGSYANRYTTNACWILEIVHDTNSINPLKFSYIDISISFLISVNLVDINTQQFLYQVDFSDQYMIKTRVDNSFDKLHFNITAKQILFWSVYNREVQISWERLALTVAPKSTQLFNKRIFDT